LSYHGARWPSRLANPYRLGVSDVASPPHNFPGKRDKVARFAPGNPLGGNVLAESFGVSRIDWIGR